MKTNASTRNLPSILILILTLASFLLVVFNVDLGHHHEEHSHGHSHRHEHDHKAYSEFGPSLFPSKIPDHVILNLTPDPLKSVAVNWRTDTTIQQGQVQVSKATHGAKFQDDARTINATSTEFQNQYLEEPKVNAYYHSAIIDDLSKGDTYVYRLVSTHSGVSGTKSKCPTLSATV